MAYFRINPTSGFEGLVKQMQQFANEIEKGVTVETGGFKPRADIYENEKGFVVVMELPGINKNEVSIKVNEERTMFITGEKKKSELENKTVIRTERIYGDFKRTFQLPEEADIEKISAEFNHGLLTLNIAKKEPVAPKEIQIAVN